ncbi:MAG: NAD(P)H-dependent oxidoreductase [Bacteroidota bacterium]
MSRIVIVFGSSRSGGDTRLMVDHLIGGQDWDLIDLSQKRIEPYDYDYQNQDDDFLSTVTNIIENYDLIIFATPVYWYSMSGILKNFFDRITDLLKLYKPLGKAFRGKSVAVLSCASEDETKEGFYMPFRESANYLHWKYVGQVHGWVEEDGLPAEVIRRLDSFRERILEST